MSAYECRFRIHIIFYHRRPLNKTTATLVRPHPFSTLCTTPVGKMMLCPALDWFLPGPHHQDTAEDGNENYCCWKYSWRSHCMLTTPVCVPTLASDHCWPMLHQTTLTVASVVRMIWRHSLEIHSISDRTFLMTPSLMCFMCLNGVLTI